MKNNLEKAKQEYFRKGGKVTVLPPQIHESEYFNPYCNRSGIDYTQFDIDEEEDDADNTTEY